MAIGDDLILERMTRREDELMAHSDALDVKMSYVLVAIVFLAQLAVSLYGAKLNHCQAIAVAVASGFVAMSGVYVYRGLALSRFETEDENRLQVTRDSCVNQLRATHPDATDEDLEAYFKEGMIEGIKRRMRANCPIVDRKVSTVRSAYRWCLVAGVIYLAVILWLVIARVAFVAPPA